MSTLVLRTADMCVLSRLDVQLFVTPWTGDCQAPLPMGLSKQEYWSGLPWPPQRDLPNPRIKPLSPAAPALQADSLPLSPQGSPDIANSKIDQKKKSLFFWDLLYIWRRQKIIQPLRKLCSILVYERGYVKKKISRERDILGNIILNRKVWEELTKKYSWCKFQRGLWENSGDS